MTITVQVNQASLAAATERIAKSLEDAKGAVQQKMASVFRDCVFANFGGAERFVVAPYAPLSPSYARKVGRSYATLEVSGKLKGAIYTGISDDGAATVSVDNATVPYATIHQRGGRNMPARPYFPVLEDGTVLPEVEEMVIQAAREELQRILSE